MKKIVITSGYFNPIHIGHINLMREAKKLGDFLVVIVNNEEQAEIKGSVHFMPEKERVEIIKALKYVDEVFLSIDKDMTVSKSLEQVSLKYQKQELLFAKGGDSTHKNVPEIETCNKFGIKLIWDVGGGKVQSSSKIIKNSGKKKIDKKQW